MKLITITLQRKYARFIDVNKYDKILNYLVFYFLN